MYYIIRKLNLLIPEVYLLKIAINLVNYERKEQEEAFQESDRRSRSMVLTADRAFHPLNTVPSRYHILTKS